MSTVYVSIGVIVLAAAAVAAGEHAGAAVRVPGQRGQQLLLCGSPVAIGVLGRIPP